MTRQTRFDFLFCCQELQIYTMKRHSRATTRRNPLFSPYKPLWCCYQEVSFTTLIGYSINEITSLGFSLYTCVGGSDTIMHTPSPHGKVQIDTGRIYFSHAMRKFVGKSVAAENAASWKTPKRERSSSTKAAHIREKNIFAQHGLLSKNCNRFLIILFPFGVSMCWCVRRSSISIHNSCCMCN